MANPRALKAPPEKAPSLAARGVSPSVEPPRTQGSAILAVAACALLWSTGGVFVKLIQWNPFAIAGIRSVIGGLVILAFLRKPRFTWSFAQISELERKVSRRTDFRLWPRVRTKSRVRRYFPVFG